MAKKQGKLSKIFAFRVEKILQRRGISKSDLSRFVGGARSTIGELIGNPGTLKTVERIAEGLEVDPWELLRPIDSADHPIEECYRLVGEAIKKGKSVSDLGAPALDRAAKANQLKQAVRILRDEIASLSPEERDKFLEGLRMIVPGGKV